MVKKNVGIILLLVFCLLPTHKIYAQSSNTNLQSNQNIRKIIGENTPDFIAKPIIFTVNAIEKFRSDMGANFENKKEKTQNQNKYIEYTELYMFTFLSFIFNNALTFYIILILIIFLILRYIGRLFFF